jgi:hypothetical protein
MILSSCFLWKFGRMILSGRKKSFAVLQPDLYIFLAWGLEVVPADTGTGESRICISLSKQGGPVESSLVK